ncbi:hypothetical protein DPMN_055362 [Dreissena polymorpha]|uniref:Uncharacterized protein n=1 Tax=Dreissena polymorpha TaxID=45954 RepID=A0A9D4CPV0_DREPO|nr:hypothetical protein DPMN_055362 [Dreissena polymorpha]
MASKKPQHEFFERDSHHGVVKRVMFKKYVQAFLAKTQHSHLRSLIIDGFAGPGRYSNEWPEAIEEYGSPLITLMVVLEDGVRKKTNKIKESSIAGDTSHQEITEDTTYHQDITGDTISHQEITRDTTYHQDITGDTISHQEITGDTTYLQDISGDTLIHQEITGDTTYHQDISGDTVIHQEITGDTTSHQDITEATTYHQDITEFDTEHPRSIFGWESCDESPIEELDKIDKMQRGDSVDMHTNVSIILIEKDKKITKHCCVISNY